MSYPFDSPSELMSTTWISGSYTPDNVVKNIRDNYTPINKNTIRNSLGSQISSIENFVNTKYLGRSGVAIESGFINNLVVMTLMPPSGTIDSNDIGVYDSHYDTCWLQRIRSNQIQAIEPGGLNLYLDSTGIIPSETSLMDLGSEEYTFSSGYLDNLLITNTLIVGSGDNGGTGIKIYGTNHALNYIKARAVGGGTPAQLYIGVGDTPAISINEDSDVKIYDKLSISTNDVNYNLNIDGSGEIKDELRVATNNGSTGLRFYGDSSAFNYIKAIPQGGGTPAILNLSVGETIAVKIDEDGYTRVCSQFGCNNVSPSGKHPLLTVGTTLGSLLTWASGVNSLLQNFGFMSDS
jgi:uncharacterized protein YbcI